MRRTTLRDVSRWVVIGTTLGVLAGVVGVLWPNLDASPFIDVTVTLLLYAVVWLVLHPVAYVVPLSLMIGVGIYPWVLHMIEEDDE